MDKKEVNYQVLEKQADFYNKNYKLFSDFEQRFGVNPWFLTHFRTYFSIRNQAYEKTKRQKISKHVIIRNFILYLIFFFRIVFKKRSTNIAKNSVCLVSFAHVKNDPHTGELRKKCFNLFYNEIPSFGNFNYKKTEVELNHLGLEYLFTNRVLYNAISINNYLKVKRYKQELLKLIVELKVSNSSDQTFVGEFEKCKKTIIFQYFEYLAYQSFFKKQDFKSLILYDENSPSKRVIWQAAKSKGIKVYAIQHGAIHDLHPAYNYTNYIVKPKLCDCTFVWGKHYKDLLINYGYGSSGLIPTGAIALDLIDEEEVKLKARQWHQKHNPQEKKIICFATQPQRDESLRREQINDVIQTISQSDYKLLIRPHPAESVDYFITILQELSVPLSQVIIDKESSLETHFMISSALITSFSTVGVEYVKYKKPMLILDYLNQDLQGYIEYGVGVKIEHRLDLVSILKTLNNYAIDENKYITFLEQYYMDPNTKVTKQIYSTVAK